MNIIGQKIKTMFSIDLRALALFRILLAIILLLDLLMRWGSLRDHYTDFGLLPRAPFLEKFANKYFLSIHLMSGLEAVQTALFVLALLFAVLLFLGYRTRFMTCLSWFLLISLQNRNPMVLNGGDVLLRVLLFWAMFLPLGACYSIDHALSEKQLSNNGARNYFGGASIAYIAQIAIVYWFTAAMKTGVEWWPEGTASYYALNLEQFTTRLGQWFADKYEFLRISTYLVFLTEWLAPFLFFSPLAFSPIRLIAIGSLAMMHLFIDLTMHIGLFPWIDIIAFVPLIPQGIWDKLWRLASSNKQQSLRIYYDGNCQFCYKMVLLLKEFLVLHSANIATCQSALNVLKSMEQQHSWVVITSDDREHYRWDGFVTVLEHTPVVGVFFKWLKLRKLAWVGDRVYKYVANNRPGLGKFTATFLPFGKPMIVKSSVEANFLTLALIVYVFMWNLSALEVPQASINYPWNVIGLVTRLDQKWNMFAPFPLKEDGWYVIPGVLKNGKKVDVYNLSMTEPSFEKPDMVAHTYKDEKWRKYMMNIWMKIYHEYRLYYGQYLCRKWNEDKIDEQQLDSFQIYFIREDTPPPGGPTVRERVLLWTHYCFKMPSEQNK